MYKGFKKPCLCPNIQQSIFHCYMSLLHCIGIPFNDALNRLAEVQEWIAAETT